MHIETWRSVTNCAALSNIGTITGNPYSVHSSIAFLGVWRERLLTARVTSESSYTKNETDFLVIHGDRDSRTKKKLVPCT